MSDALRLDLETLAQHGNTVVIYWDAPTKQYVVATTRTDSRTHWVVLDSALRGRAEAAPSLDDAVGHLHDIVMGEDE